MKCHICLHWQIYVLSAGKHHVESSSAFWGADPAFWSGGGRGFTRPKKGWYCWVGPQSRDSNCQRAGVTRRLCKFLTNEVFGSVSTRVGEGVWFVFWGQWAFVTQGGLGVSFTPSHWTLLLLPPLLFSMNTTSVCVDSILLHNQGPSRWRRCLGFGNEPLSPTPTLLHPPLLSSASTASLLI